MEIQEKTVFWTSPVNLNERDLDNFDLSGTGKLKLICGQIAVFATKKGEEIF